MVSLCRVGLPDVVYVVARMLMRHEAWNSQTAAMTSAAYGRLVKTQCHPLPRLAHDKCYWDQPTDTQTDR